MAYGGSYGPEGCLIRSGLIHDHHCDYCIAMRDKFIAIISLVALREHNLIMTVNPVHPSLCRKYRRWDIYYDSYTPLYSTRVYM